MERLTFTDEEMERIETDCPVKNDYHIDRFCDNVCDEFQYNCPFMKMAQKLKVYEDKQEQGLLIESPCKVGDTVYFLSYTEIYECNVKEINITKSGIRFSTWCEKWRIRLSIYLESFGKDVFLTLSEAEEALAKMGGSHEDTD